MIIQGEYFRDSFSDILFRRVHFRVKTHLSLNERYSFNNLNIIPVGLC